jgi:hypothetical protein
MPGEKTLWPAPRPRQKGKGRDFKKKMVLDDIEFSN